jgi:hypothetical protein
MCNQFYIILFFLSAIKITQGQVISCNNDTTVNRMEFLRLKQLVQDCDDEMKQRLHRENQYEDLINVQQKRIKFLEDLVVNREDWIVKKCPKFKKTKKRRRLSQKFS